MIQPIKLISAKTMVTNPVALNPNMAYKNATNFASKGQKLNISTKNAPLNSNQGRKLDILA